MIYRWRLGYCTTPTFGSVAVDVVDLTAVNPGVTGKPKVLGGTFRSLNGTGTIDRIDTKNGWDLTLGPLEFADSWPVQRVWEQTKGPWMLYDQSRPNLLTGEQRLLTTWTNSAGTNLAERMDGAFSMAIAGTAQMGSATNSDRSLLVPVVAGTSYFCAVSAAGTGAWSLAISVGWYGISGTTALSTSSLGSFTVASALSTNTILDGSRSAVRVGAAATAPANALYAQIRLTCSVAAVDISDPVLLASPTDPGPAWFVVDVDNFAPTFLLPGETGISLALSEM